MPAFGARSMRNRYTLHESLIGVLDEAILYYDFTILCGHRSKDKQDEAFNNKRSMVEWPNSKHNTFPSLAVDVAPYYAQPPHIRWNRLYEFVYLHGLIIGLAARRGITLRSGQNWDMDDELITDQGFNDFPHIELVL